MRAQNQGLEGHGRGFSGQRARLKGPEGTPQQIPHFNPPHFPPILRQFRCDLGDRIAAPKGIGLKSVFGEQN